jgi:hypothetical protein
MVIQFQFTNVPEEQDIVLNHELRCEGCEKPNLTPFRVRTCEHRLCGHCWQKSACNINDEENKCIVCGTETDLLCFRDHKIFVGHNVYNGELILAVSSAREIISESKFPDDESTTKALSALDRHEKAVFSHLEDQIVKKRQEKRAREAWSSENCDKQKKNKYVKKSKPYERKCMNSFNKVSQDDR